MLPSPRRRAPWVRPPPRRATPHHPRRGSPPKPRRSASVHHRPPVDHGRRPPGRHRTRFRNQNGSGCDFLPVDLAPIHVFHGVFRLVGRGEFHVAVHPSQVRVDVVLGEFHVFYCTVGAEDFEDVVLVDGSCEAADVDFRGAGSGGTATALSRGPWPCEWKFLCTRSNFVYSNL